MGMTKGEVSTYINTGFFPISKMYLFCMRERKTEKNQQKLKWYCDAVLSGWLLIIFLQSFEALSALGKMAPVLAII